MAYTFICETEEGISPARPNQLLVPTLMLEWVSESGLTGVEDGENAMPLLPDIQLWHPESNWKVRMGVGFPIGSDRENDVAGHFQVENHYDWGHRFK